jgi:hypothetical protein
MKKIRMFLFIGAISVLLSPLMAQDSTGYSFTQMKPDEFELLNLCHCIEYLQLRDLDYVKWKSEDAKKEHLKEMENDVFSRYPTKRRLQYGHYFQTKIDSTLFLKQGISVYFGSKLNFRRLDSLYYEPIVQYYVSEISKTENLPYFGFGDRIFFVDCFYKVKEIPLKQELEYFIKANKNSKE